VYDLPAEIDVREDGPLRIITLNRPEALNAVNDAVHTGLARLWPRLSEDHEARAAVLTGSGRAFCAGGDLGYLAELRRDAGLRARTIAHGRDLVLGMARIPAQRAASIGLANHVVADPFGEAMQCAKRIAGLPRQAVESTKRLLNLHLERAVLATLDFATTAEDQSFQTEDFRLTIAKLTNGSAS
jgi:enoyl-CoA hydratase/carnithine racemase